MLFQIKSKPEDFIVEEILPKGIPSGKGDFLYVFFEKTNLTTMEVVDFLTKRFHIQREELGIAGLKDKAGITKQRISISQRSLEKIGGEEIFIETLGERVIILEKSFHSSPLKVASNAGNHFTIRLRARKEISKEIKNQIENNVEKIREKGLPNCFGMQRFGKGKKNFFEAKERLEKLASQYREKGTLIESDLPYHLRFLLQAYASMYFNEYALNRREKGLFLLQGDILVDRFNSNGVRTAVYDSQKIYQFDYQKLKKENSDSNFFEPKPHPSPLLLGEGDHERVGEVDENGFFANAQNDNTEIDSSLLLEGPIDVEQYDENKRFPTGPMIGRNLLLAGSGTKARVRDDQLISLAGFDEGIQQVCGIYNLRGVRRVLFVKVPDLQFERIDNDILLEFSLPTGSYATVLLAFVLQGIDYLTLKDNSLVIPRINEK